MGVIVGALGSERESRGGRYLMRKAINGHQRSSEVIREPRMAVLEPISGHQRSSEVIREPRWGQVPVLEALLVVLAAGAAEFQAHTPVHPPDEGGH
jgi:hypothetical protein